MAQQAPPDGDYNLGPAAVSSSAAVFAVTMLCLFIPRIWTHLVPKNKLKASEYIVSLAVVLELAGLVLFAVAVGKGLGRHSYYLTAEQVSTISWYSFWEGFFGPWSSAVARVSIVALLLQFNTSVRWRVALCILAAIQIVVVISWDVILLVQCRPIRASWEYVPGGQCWTLKQQLPAMYVTVGLGTLSDLGLAIMPIFLIWPLNRPQLERIVVIALMALSFCATGVVLARGIRWAILPPNSDILQEVTYQIMLCRLESCALIAAACAPFLKGPIERFLSHRFGISRFSNQMRSLNSIHS